MRDLRRDTRLAVDPGPVHEGWFLPVKIHEKPRPGYDANAVTVVHARAGHES